MTGSRRFTDYPLFRDALEFEIGEAFRLTPGHCVVVHGGARGADSMTYLATRNLSWVDIEVHRAEWDKYGKAAGMIRNREMLNSGVDVCLAFYKRGAENIGTRGMVRLCRKASVPVKEFWED